MTTEKTTRILKIVWDFIVMLVTFGTNHRRKGGTE